MQRTRTGTLIALFVTLSAFAVSANAVAPLISTLAERFGLPASRFGIFLALQFVSFSVASFVGGFVKEKLRLTNNHLVAAGLVIITACFLLAPALLRSAVAIAAWIIPLGLAGGAVETFSSIEISALSTSGSSKNLCVSQGFYSIGAIAAPQVVYLCFGAGLGWESTFVVFTALSLAIGLYFVLNSRGRLRAPAPPAAAARTGAAAPVRAAGTAFSLPCSSSCWSTSPWKAFRRPGCPTSSRSPTGSPRATPPWPWSPSGAG